MTFRHGSHLGSRWPHHEPTVRAIIERLQASKHQVHRGAAMLVAAEFLPDERTSQAEEIAAANGWPAEAVLAGLHLGKQQQ